MENQSAFVIEYHNRTKHRLERYALGPETIDWEDQPDAFRRFNGCEIINLTRPGQELNVLYADLDKPESVESKPVNLISVSLLLELSFGLSAWKQFGPSRWALRCNPSSGNLHPTEAYLVNTDAELLKPGVYHYVSHDHALEKRCEFNRQLSDTGLYIGLSSIHWREAWKYGERAFRYCQHDTGHALGALRYAAAVMGWSVEILAEWSDDDVANLLGINRSEDFHKKELEFPDLICHIHPQNEISNTDNFLDLLELAKTGNWQGSAASLRAYHFYKWSIIDEVAIAAAKPRTQDQGYKQGQAALIKSSCTKTAADIIRQRRSAQQFDGKMPSLPIDDFYRMLSAVLPAAKIPFDMWQWPPQIHLFIFVHRIEGLEPGLYALPRTDEILDKLRSATSTDFLWQLVTPLPDSNAASVPLYHLYSGNCRQIAKTVSCHQPIASDSAYSLAMVAEFRENIETSPWHYRRLFWESGLIGQVLYLEAEAAGVRGTGIGCYFDDSVHELLGFKDNTFQSLYHFTVGKPLEDKRLETLPPYGHLT
jgi:SagB-type dehydrogenase family enzyme